MEDYGIFMSGPSKIVTSSSAKQPMRITLMYAHLSHLMNSIIKTIACINVAS